MRPPSIPHFSFLILRSKTAAVPPTILLSSFGRMVSAPTCALCLMPYALCLKKRVFPPTTLHSSLFTIHCVKETFTLTVPWLIVSTASFACNCLYYKQLWAMRTTANEMSKGAVRQPLSLIIYPMVNGWYGFIKPFKRIAFGKTDFEYLCHCRDRGAFGAGIVH